MDAEINIRVVTLQEAGSTNSWLAENCNDYPTMTVVRAVAQTHGRGQRGNCWESEPGRNLTISFLHRPAALPAAQQFCISEATALAVADTLGDFGIEARVKWPNDIYVGDKKICGILIENAISGRNIVRTIIGIGININQKHFFSDAPNPVSLFQLTGSEHPLDKIMQNLTINLAQRLTAIDCEGDAFQKNQHQDFLRRLWRGDGFYPYADTASGEKFSARIADIAPDGFLTLECHDGTLRRYAFKEVVALL